MLYSKEYLGDEWALPSKMMVIEGMYQNFSTIVNSKSRGMASNGI